MKHFFIGTLLLFILNSCGSKQIADSMTGNPEVTTQENNKNKPEKEEIVNEVPSGDIMTTARGKVKDMSLEEGCNFLLEVITKKGDTLLLDGGQLPEQYRKEGTMVTFTYRLSKRPSKCPMGQPVLINEIGL